MREMTFTQDAYNEILKTVGTLPAETGGILLGNRDDYVVQKFFFDDSGRRGTASYDPDVGFLNRVVKREWEENGLALLGFVHSHPIGFSRLSGDMGNGIGDIGYIKTIFSAMPALDKFLVPIIFPTRDNGKFEIFPYMAIRGDEENYKMLDIKIIPSYQKAKEKPMEALDRSRIKGAISPELMSSSHVVCVGVGGASGICEDLVRTGLGKLTVIDFDTVDASNLTTQGFYRSDIGKPKVQALGERIAEINPHCEYTMIDKDFLKMREGELSEIINDASLILMMTDDFYAQKRGNLISLKYKIPALFAIMYERARCAEITFTIPGVTPACHRCATSSRYDQYDQGYQNDVTSSYSTVFQTHYFNASIGMIALAILHNDIEGVEFGNWFGQRWNRNLVQLRLNNNYASMFADNQSLFERTFSTPEAAQRTFTFDSIWQTIEPEAAPKYVDCPDCGGIGDLSRVEVDRSV